MGTRDLQGGWRSCDFSPCKVQLDPKAIAWCLGYFGRDAGTWVRSCCTSPPPCVPLPAALPRVQGSSNTLRRVSVIEGGETVLECEAKGTPAPWVTWLKDGQPVAAGDRLLLTEQGRRLHIPRAEVAHAGHYTCLVTSGVQVSVTSLLWVTCPIAPLKSPSGDAKGPSGFVS
uniref:Ig-like domain-containing protein n=1 Tax=Catharus ustulatus TaxID=91951 RepID=A0A8C3ULL5_CATUS